MAAVVIRSQNEQASENHVRPRIGSDRFDYPGYMAIRTAELGQFLINLDQILELAKLPP
ncbi:hypothetical protein [Mesorhizobium captivum]|uniref:hypothetical protein n=1 Tax=Mesorhizobium captivum TaxID=3072319 RepID=UPI002A23BBBC|nr:hypothetical protein [Mesorhizobium sp. VK3C]MDX8450324.1 hypothetical protein [Mesorhizobium sp. VK3C]